MRFSSVFQLPAVPQHPAAAPVRELAPVEKITDPAVQSTPGEGLPDDLDARVRLIGEWQLGEGY
jgi:hypothetical protein